jgi:hypothetical protein
MNIASIAILVRQKTTPSALLSAARFNEKSAKRASEKEPPDHRDVRHFTAIALALRERAEELRLYLSALR